jgi:predicted enzyme related to lactoylglutathione lyase
MGSMILMKQLRLAAMYSRVAQARRQALCTLRSGFFYIAEAEMKRVTGIGGIFFQARDPVGLRTWYKKHLGIDVQEWGGTAFAWTDDAGNPTKGSTVWSIGAAGGDHFAPSTSSFMVNYRVDNLAALLQALREEGCNVLEKMDDSEYGKFGWVMDPEGNKVELWQPPEGQ